METRFHSGYGEREWVWVERVVNIFRPPAHNIYTAQQQTLYSYKRSGKWVEAMEHGKRAKTRKYRAFELKGIHVII